MKFTTALNFDGNCREAFETYARIFGGTIKAMITNRDVPADDANAWAAERPDNIIHAWLDVGDQSIMGADMDTDWAPNIDKPKNGFDVTLHTTDKAEAERWFNALSEGGKVTMAFHEMFWTPGFGGCIDKFGVPWMVNTIPGEGWTPSQNHGFS